MRHHYKAFGLHIHSEWKLPELMPALHEAEAQLVIETGRVEAFSPPEAPRPDRAPEESAYYQATPSRVILHWPEVGSFAVEEGEQITIDVNPGVDKDLARLPLLGPVFCGTPPPA